MKTKLKPKNHTCVECGKPADWIRYTQFAGDPYCTEHAHLESDFLRDDDDDDSYPYWDKIVTEGEIQ